jgi:hypothetical protein
LPADEQNVWKTGYRNLLNGDLGMLAPGQLVDHIPTSPPSDSRTTHSPDIGEFLDVPNRDTSSMGCHESSSDHQDSDKAAGTPESFEDKVSYRSIENN